jgi:hypothetical protein
MNRAPTLAVLGAASLALLGSIIVGTTGGNNVSGVASAATASPTLDPSFDRISASDPNYATKVDFNVVCSVARVAPDDPIVKFGQPGASHSHVFAGNKSINASSTYATLVAGTTNCLLDRDTASYWQPQLYANGTTTTGLLPNHIRAYYRAGVCCGRKVSHIPAGLKMVAGNAAATTPQDPGIAGWQCRQVSPDVNTVPKQSTIPTCASTDLLEGSVIFMNCWDGVHLDSADHKSHMSYADDTATCDAAHPVRLPRITLGYRYAPGTTTSAAKLAAMPGMTRSGLTLHADFFQAWSQPTLDWLVDQCINASVHCGDVKPTHFPGTIPPR